MTKTILVTALLILTSAAHAEPVPSRGTSSRCWTWIADGYHEWTCKDGNPLTDATLNATARDAMRRNNLGNTYRSDTTMFHSDGSTSSSTTITTFPRRY